MALALVLMAALAGTAFAKEGQAMVRVAHLSPDAPAVDEHVHGSPAFTNLSFRTVTAYAPLPARPHRVQVVAAGTAGPAVIDTTLNVQAGTNYTVAAIGTLAQIRPLVLVDDLELPAAFRARVRVVHASPNAPPVDVAVAGGTVLFGNLAFGNASAYQTVDAGTVDLEVRAAGTQNVVLPLPDVTFAGGTVYTAFAIGLLERQPPLEVLVVQDAPAG